MISPDLLSRINCSTCLENINSGLITPGKLVQMDIGYNGFKVFRIGSPRFFTTEERPNRVDLTATPITHLSLALIDFDHSNQSPTGLQRHQYISDGLRADPPLHSFFHTHICPKINKYEAAPFPNRRKHQTH